MGDLNGRTNVEDDFIRDNTDDYSPINTTMYNKDPIYSFPLNRENTDTNNVDEQGRLILDLCKSSGMRILNGRIPGDLHGDFTRYPSNLCDMPSVIDYCLCSDPLIRQVKSFSVLPFSGISDHCCISITIEINTDIPTIIPKPIEKTDLTQDKIIYKFDDTQAHTFAHSIRSDIRVEHINSLLAQTNLDVENIDEGVSTVNEIFLSAAKKAKFISRIKGNTKSDRVRPSHCVAKT